MEGEIYDFYIDMRNRRFRNWAELVPQYVYVPLQKQDLISVPTPDSFKFAYLLSSLSNALQQAIIVGESGVGKTKIVKSFMDNVDQNLVATYYMNFSSQTQPQVFLDLLTNKERVFTGSRNTIE